VTQTSANWFRTGLRSRCPRCGEGKLFQGFLSLPDSCQVCGLDYGAFDSADGPAVFIMFVAGFIVVGGALFVELAYQPPYWVHAVLWIPLSAVLCLGLLRPFKGWMIALQFKNDAAEGRLSDD